MPMPLPMFTVVALPSMMVPLAVALTSPPALGLLKVTVNCLLPADARLGRTITGTLTVLAPEGIVTWKLLSGTMPAPVVLTLTVKFAAAGWLRIIGKKKAALAVVG